MEKKFAVFCVAVGDTYDEIIDISHASIANYAAKIGAELVVVREHANPIWARFQIYELLERYDRILYLDADILVRPDSPDLFQIVPATHLGVCITSNNTAHHDSDIEELQKINGNIGWSKDYFNAGVLLASAQHRELFRQPITIRSCRYADQDVLNYRAQALQVPIFDVGYVFNHTTVPPGREAMTSYFTHFCGMKNTAKLKIMKQSAQELAAIQEASSFKAGHSLNIRETTAGSICKSSTLMFTIAVGGYDRIFCSCIETQRKYAQKCGYQYFVIDSLPWSISPNDASWFKVEMMKYACQQGFERVFFVDSDCEIKNHAPPVFDLIDGENHWIYLARGKSGRVNSGVVALFNHAQVVDFLELLLERGETPVPKEDKAPYENGHFIHYLKKIAFSGEMSHHLWNNNSHLSNESYIQHYSGGDLRMHYLKIMKIRPKTPLCQADPPPSNYGVMSLSRRMACLLDEIKSSGNLCEKISRIL